MEIKDNFENIEIFTILLKSLMTLMHLLGKTTDESL